MKILELPVKELIRNMRQGIMIVDDQGKIQAVNQAFSKVTGFNEEDVFGKPIYILQSDPYDTLNNQIMWDTVSRDGYWEGEISNRQKEGEVYTTWLVLSVIKNIQTSEIHYIGIFSDLTPRKSTEERLKFLAHHDPLTGLANRVLLMDRLKQAIAHAKRYQEKMAVIFVDLDGFKPVNDAFGHLLGDEFLKEVAKRLSICVREEDTLARLGGDEFCFVLHHLDRESHAMQVAEKILGNLKMPFCVKNKQISISASIGISLFPEHGQKEDDLLLFADAAMYSVKKLGGNGISLWTGTGSSTS